MPEYPLPTSGIVGADIGSHPSADDEHILNHFQVHGKLNGLHVDVAADFGADMTGATDSSAALDDALDAAAGGVLWIPPGILKIEPDVLVTRADSSAIRAAGKYATQILVTGTGTWGAKVEHTLCSIGGFGLETDSAVTYGVGASTPASSGSIHDTEITNIWVKPTAAMTAAFALGPDHPGSSSVDLAGTKLDHLTAYADSTGIYTHGFLLGNGTSGNVLQNEAYACQVVRSQYGVTIRGSGLKWWGGGMGYVTEADIYVTAASGDLITFAGVRSEVGAMVLKQGYVGRGYSAIHLLDYQATAYDPPDDETIINCSTHLIMTGGAYYTVGGNARVVVDEFNGGGLIFEARGVSFDSADPYRGVSTAASRHTTGTMFDDSGLPTANPGADSAASWNTYTPTITGTGWALGNSVVSARWASANGIVALDVTITWGSTATYGTGALEISMPAAALPAATTGIGAFRGVVLDTGNNFYNLNALLDPVGLAKVSLYSEGASGAWGGGYTSTNPVTGSTGDSVNLVGTYEAA